jgi:hypothetical protein
MPRNRPGKKERAVKRTQDQRALEKLHDQIHSERSSGVLHQLKSKKDTKVNKVNKPEKSDRAYTSSEVDAIVHAAVTAAVTTTKALLSGEKPKQTPDNVKPARSLAERITSPANPPLTKEAPARPLAERISFPKKH